MAEPVVNLLKERRLALDKVLKSIPGAHVYYQPPTNVTMTYPAIRYERYRIDITSADNVPYLREPAFQVTVIDKDPDSPIVEAISKLPKCYFNRHYTAANLNHDVFVLYY